MWQEQVPQAGCLRLGLEFLDHRQHRPRSQRLGLVRNAAFMRIDVLVHEGEQPLAKRLDLGE
jgi:hypothetical protein